MASQVAELTRGRGRPSTYTPELAAKLCEEIATRPDGLEVICEDKSLPAWQTVYGWRARNPEFAEQFAQARKAQLELIAEQIIPLADSTIGGSNNDINSARLRVDARKWVLSKLLPDTYGDKLDLTSKGEKLETPSHAIDARIQSIVLTAQRRAAGVDDGLEDEARRLLE